MLLTVSVAGTPALTHCQLARERVLTNLLGLAQSLLDHPAADLSLLLINDTLLSQILDLILVLHFSSDYFLVFFDDSRVVLFRDLLFLLYWLYFFLRSHLLLQSGSLFTLQAEAASADLLLAKQLLVHFLVAN